MLKFYDPDGNLYKGTDHEINLQFNKDMQDPNKKIIKQEKLKNGFFVSTIWLGINHNFMGFVKSVETGIEASLHIYETMVFKKNSRDEVDMHRYSTRAEAIKGHAHMVKKWKSKGHQ